MELLTSLRPSPIPKSKSIGTIFGIKNLESDKRIDLYREVRVFDKHIEFLNVLFDLHNYHYKLKIRYYLAGESVSVQSSPHLVIVT